MDEGQIRMDIIDTKQMRIVLKEGSLMNEYQTV